MKKLLCVSSGIFTCAFVLFVYTTTYNRTIPELLISDVEALSEGDNINIVCRCSSAALFPSKSCTASHHGNPCAQSGMGGNVDCRSYDSNCH